MQFTYYNNEKGHVVVAVISASDILEADKLFEALTSSNPVKSRYISVVINANDSQNA